VPQRGQKLRVPRSVDAYDVACPCSQRKLVRGTLNQATNGAPDARRQMEQWQVHSWKAPVPAS
jgi:hypothetical protein